MTRELNRKVDRSSRLTSGIVMFKSPVQRESCKPRGLWIWTIVHEVLVLAKVGTPWCGDKRLAKVACHLPGVRRGRLQAWRANLPSLSVTCAERLVVTLWNPIVWPVPKLIPQGQLLDVVSRHLLSHNVLQELLIRHPRFGGYRYCQGQDRLP